MSSPTSAPLEEIEVDRENLYHEEVFTDLKVATIRRLSPVKTDGSRDETRPLLQGARLTTWELMRAGIDVTAQFTTGINQRIDDRPEVRCERGTIDQQGFSCAANTGPAHLGVQNNISRPFYIRRCMHIDMTEPFQMSDDRHPCIGLDARNQVFTAARDDDVDAAVKT